MPLKLGVIGCGVIGRKHVAAAMGDPAIDVVALADLEEDAARTLADEHGIGKVYASAEAILADPEVQAVVLALVTGVRGAVALDSLRAGKHVLLEKPPAMDVQELQRIADAAGDRVVASCSSRLTFNRVAETAREVVAGGELGPIRTIHVRCVQPVGPARPEHTPPPWRAKRSLNGGGYLVNWGVYDVDFMLYVLGDRFAPSDVLAQSWPVAPHLAEGRVDPASDAENHFVALLRGTEGQTFLLERGEFTSLPKSMAWQISGDQASLSLAMVADQAPPTLVLHRADPENGLVSDTVLDEYGSDVQHDMPVRDFAAAIAEGRPPRTDLHRAMRIQRIIDAIDQSIENASHATSRR